MLPLVLLLGLLATSPALAADPRDPLLAPEARTSTSQGRPEPDAAATLQPAPPGFVLVPIPTPAASEFADPRELKRARKRAKREAQREAEAQRSEADFQFLGVPRGIAYVGVAPVMVTRQGEDRHGRRFRERSFTVGLGYSQHLLRRIGVRSVLEFGAGKSRIGYTEYEGECCMPTSKHVGPAYSLSAEAAPVFGPLGSLYFAPGLQVRTLWLPTSSARLRYKSLGEEKSEVHHVRFQSPLAMINARLAMGLMLAERRLDLGWGVDVGHPFNGADRALGLFFRAGFVLGASTPATNAGAGTQ